MFGVVGRELELVGVWVSDWARVGGGKGLEGGRTKGFKAVWF